MFGREARLPIDLCFGTSPDGDDNSTYLQYVEKLKSDLERAYELAVTIANMSHDKNKRYYDNRVRDHVLDKGDRVLIRVLGLPASSETNGILTLILSLKNSQICLCTESNLKRDEARLKLCTGTTFYPEGTWSDSLQMWTQSRHHRGL